MKRFLAAILLLPALVLAATTTPVQLLSPTGSTAGQAIVSNGPSSAPTWQAIPTTTGTLAQFAATTSAQLAGVLSDETGSGFAVFNGSPAFTGTPTGPTASNGTSNTMLANTAFVANTLASPPAIGSTAPAAGTFTTLSATTIVATSTITPSQTAGIVGTTTNNNANAGSVGEYVTQSGSGTSLTSNTAANVTSISLTAGDWDVSGSVQFLPAGGTTVSAVESGISITSATFGGVGSFNSLLATLTTGSPQLQSTPVFRLSLASTTTVYLVARSTFGVSTMTANSLIRARRVR